MIPATPDSQGVDPSALDEAMDYLASICGEMGTSDCVVLKNGRVIWQGANVNHRHLVWSCTKSFTSTCLGLLWDDGKCEPPMPACTFFPELRSEYPRVTLEQLATFTSGYRCEEQNPLVPLPRNYEPGAAFHYSAESDLLAAILTRIAGEPLEQLFLRRIGNKIGLTHENFRWLSRATIDGITLNGGAGYQGSGIECTALAMARFGWFYCKGGKWEGNRLISRRYMDYAMTPRVGPLVPPHDPSAWYTGLPGCYGLNWWVNGIRAHGGRMWPDAPPETFAAQGNLNTICLIVPSWDLVIVRLGGDRIIETDLYNRLLAIMSKALRPAKAGNSAP